MKLRSISKLGNYTLATLLLLSAACRAQMPGLQSGTPHTYLQIVSTRYPLGNSLVLEATRAALSSPSSQSVRGSNGDVWQTTQHGLIELNAKTGVEKLLTGSDGLPILTITGISIAPNGQIWLATHEGAILYRPYMAPEQRWFYFWGKRYLADNDVQQIIANDNGAWVRTGTGIAHIEFEPYTLDRKSELFLDRIHKRHTRYGYVSSCTLLQAGDVNSFRMESADNDGLWTSIFVAAEIFRYRATHSAQALQNAQTSLEAMLRLVSITGVHGMPARSLIHRGDYLPPDGEWHWTSDGQWKWKGDTSSDELVGHFLAYWMAYRFLPNHGDRAKIRAAVSDIAGGLIEHQLNMLGYSGKVTTWGRYGPAYLKTVSSRERALDSLEVLSHIRVAYEITGDRKFLEAYRFIGYQLGYFQNLMYFNHDLRPDKVNYSDEELAFLSFYPLINSEKDQALHTQFVAAMTNLWESVQKEHNPLWNFIYAEGTGSKSYECHQAMDTLERIPLSTISWTVKNSQRADLLKIPLPGRQGELQATTAIPPDQHAVMKWNSNPFEMDGGDGGRSEDDGSFFLLPYWFARFYQLDGCSSTR